MKIQVKVTPRSSCNKVEKIDDKHYKVRVTTVPEKGKANFQVIKLLSKYFNISKSQIEVIHGKATLNKIVEIEA